jgi:hypothetical protein
MSFSEILDIYLSALTSRSGLAGVTLMITALAVHALADWQLKKMSGKK